MIRGFAAVVGRELTKLYVDPFFQHQGIGAHLPDYAVKVCGARTLWALEKNEGALRFYARHGFKSTGEWKYEEGTRERLVRMELKPNTKECGKADVFPHSCVLVPGGRLIGPHRLN